MRSRLFLTTLAIVIVNGCSGSNGTGDDGSSADAGMTDSALETALPLSCLMIRNCIYLCAANQACAASCVERGSAAERALFEQVVACSMQACPTADIDCRCDQECYGGGACIAVVDECTRAMQEGFCTMCV